MSLKRKARNLLLNTSNNVRSSINGTKKSSLRVALVSSKDWKGKVYDDLLLQKELVRRGFRANIVVFDDPSVDYFTYDIVLIRSMWGYQNNLRAFSNWIANVRSSGIKVYNSLDIVKENYDKTKQMKTLKEFPTIPTKVISKNILLKIRTFNGFKRMVGKNGEGIVSKFPFVIKPAISASGENTFLIKSEEDFLNNLPSLIRVNQGRTLLLQSFIPEIKNGELAVVMINGQISHVVRRFPGVLTKSDYKIELETGKIDEKLSKLCHDISLLPGYREALYLRIDVVKRGSSYVIMEVEAFEPALFFFLLQGEDRKRALDKLIDGILK